MSDLKEINLSIDGHVAIVTLNSPPVNALSRTMGDELTTVMDRLSEDAAVRAVVLTGAGHVFCAGADLKGRDKVLRNPGDMPAHSRRTRECFHAIRECAKPVIAALNGPALGSGVGMAASSDILVASEKACLGLPEINVGLMGGGRHAMRLFGHSLTRRMMLTGYRVPGPELYRLGIAEYCTEPGKLMNVALELAREIAAKSPIASRLVKQTLNTIEDMSLRDGYRYEQEMTAFIATTNDAKEARLAFLEKRSPVFTGS